MKTAQLRKLHKRLLKGEHLLVVNYGMLKRDIFSMWYTEDEEGKYLQLVGQNGALLFSPDIMALNPTYPIGLRDREDIRNYQASNTELYFLESDRLEIETDHLSPTQRLVKDYTDLLAVTRPEFKDTEPYVTYQSEVDRLAA